MSSTSGRSLVRQEVQAGHTVPAFPHCHPLLFLQARQEFPSVPFHLAIRGLQAGPEHLAHQEALAVPWARAHPESLSQEERPPQVLLVLQVLQEFHRIQAHPARQEGRVRRQLPDIRPRPVLLHLRAVLVLLVSLELPMGRDDMAAGCRRCKASVVVGVQVCLVGRDNRDYQDDQVFLGVLEFRVFLEDSTPRRGHIHFVFQHHGLFGCSAVAASYRPLL